VVLKINDDMCDIVMLTSKTWWNSMTRRLDEDEVKFFSIFGKRRDRTYFAPVKYPLRHIFRKGTRYPDHRVADLIKEFL